MQPSTECREVNGPYVYGFLPFRSHLGPRHFAAERERRTAAVSSHLLVIRSAAPRRSIGHFIEPAGRPGPHRADDWFGGWCELPDDSTLTDAEALRRALEEQSADEPTRPETTATTEPRHGTL